MIKQERARKSQRLAVSLRCAPDPSRARTGFNMCREWTKGYSPGFHLFQRRSGISLRPTFDAKAFWNPSRFGRKKGRCQMDMSASPSARSTTFNLRQGRFPARVAMKQTFRMMQSGGLVFEAPQQHAIIQGPRTGEPAAVWAELDRPTGAYSAEQFPLLP